MIEEYQEKQPIAYKILKNAILNDEYSHAYLFETNGFYESFNFIMAFIKGLLCPEKKTKKENCNNCHQCEVIESGNFPEIKIINPDGMWIKKQQLQELQKEFNEKALIGTKRIYIINHAEKLNKHSANSILKFLEEPDNDIIAILITDNIFSILETIKSRCQTIRFKESLQIKDANEIETIKRIIKLNHEEELDETIETKIKKVIEFINYYEKNHLNTLIYTNKLWHPYIKTKEELIDAFEIMILYYKDLINLKLKKETEIFNSNKEIENILEKNKIKELCDKLNIIIEKKNSIKYNVNANLLIDKLIIDLEGGI
ncbi:MAG: hypothetical protein IKG27_01790 [Bacilli bacterium]|nr:hypothetical protein [Bacilli bacterium]